MLEQAWEVYATELANARDADSILKAIENIVAQAGITFDNGANVIYGYDTR